MPASYGTPPTAADAQATLAAHHKPACPSHCGGCEFWVSHYKDVSSLHPGSVGMTDLTYKVSVCEEMNFGCWETSVGTSIPQAYDAWTANFLEHRFGVGW
jgi:hypothetical protein